jgi:hypothetical protein
MAQTIIDLTGAAGLAQNFFGDTDMVTPQPNLRLQTERGGMAGGLFNPFLRSGYMAPTTSTKETVTTDNAVTNPLITVEYDQFNNDIYWTDGVKQIFRGDGLNDSTLARVDELAGTSYMNHTWTAAYDLQVYELNGERQLYTVGAVLPSYPATLQQMGQQDASAPYRVVTVGIDSASGVTPVLEEYRRAFGSGSSSTLTIPVVTVDQRDNRILVVVAMTGSTTDITGITYNGVSMTSIASSSLSPTYRVCATVAPPVGSASVVVTYAGATSNRLAYAFVLSGAGQTLPAAVAVENDNGTDTFLYCEPANNGTDQYLLGVLFGDANRVSHESDNWDSIETNSQAYGYDEFVVSAWNGGPFLQLAAADLPYYTFPDKRRFLTSITTNAFKQALKSDYAFMRNADNGFSYIFADNRVHKLDGTITGGANGTVTKDVIIFPQDFRIKDAVDYRSRMYIAVHRYPLTSSPTTLNTFTGLCGIVVWNRSSNQFSVGDYIELPGVREIKKIWASPDGVLKLITISDNGLTELRQFGYNDSGGVVFPVQFTLGIGAHPQYPDGLTVAGDKSIWLANDGYMYADKANAVVRLCEIELPATNSTTDLAQNITSGAVLYGHEPSTASGGFRTNKQAVTYSFETGTTPTHQRIYPFDLTTSSNGSQTPHQGDVYTQVVLLPIGTVARQLRVYNAPITGSGTEVIATVKLYFNQSATVGMTKSITKDEARRGYVNFKLNKPYIHAVQIEIEWATGTSIGSDMYLPSTAVLTYDDDQAESPDSE